MRKCIAIAKEMRKRGNYPTGALVARDGEVLAIAGNSLIQGNDPTAHPEIAAIRQAAARIDSRYVERGILVSTLEPCPMCTSAAIWARMDGIVIGADQTDALAWACHNSTRDLTWRQIRIRCKTVVDAGTPRLWVKSHVLRDECIALFAE